MRMYKDGHEAYVEKQQVELMKDSGWSTVKPKLEEEPLEKEGSETVVENPDKTDSDKPVVKSTAKIATKIIPKKK